MEYLLIFLEGILTFISPCLLPMLPIYIFYIAGAQSDKAKTITNAVGFVCGFSVVFLLLGALAGTLGTFLARYSTLVNIVGGLIIIIFGLNYIGILRIGFLNKSKNMDVKVTQKTFFSSAFLGMVFSIGWTPCVGAFLGSALTLAAHSGGTLKGILLLATFSLGLAIPFVLSALLIDQLSVAFSWIKRNFKIITTISGVFLVLLGISMMTGFLSKLLGLLSV